MGNITIMPETTKKPITLIGEMAGICYGSNTNDPEKNYKRGLECVRTNHGRTLEFPQIYVVLDGYSARVMRELYTHIGGAPTRLQASTRYIQYDTFDYFIPPKISANPEALKVYTQAMENIRNAYLTLDAFDIPKEDAANILPLGMKSKMVLRTNLRNLTDMMRQRTCTRAYIEMRDIMFDLRIALGEYAEEWNTLMEQEGVYAPKCEVLGYCPEKFSCGRKPKKED